MGAREGYPSIGAEGIELEEIVADGELDRALKSDVGCDDRGVPWRCVCTVEGGRISSPRSIIESPAPTFVSDNDPDWGTRPSRNALDISPAFH